MRKDLIETEAIENYLLRRFDKEERQQFELNMLLDSSLADKAEAQSGVYRLVRRFWRKQKRKQLQLIHEQLLSDPSFSRQLL